ncbi:hypothetical protein [Streptomyces sp. 1222.5]|uniref:hypothetical protein n=1 Tax=Streptomyces sp. 1222.5 TaxID=1881026 RepID=UPI003EB82950
MNARRSLGAGPQPQRYISAAQADVLGELPDVHLPDLADMRTRGVLGSPPPHTTGRRRPLGAGGRADEEQPLSPEPLER